jgi:hypothetical protein
MTNLRTLVVTALLAVGASPVAAHHSPAMFDMTKEVVLEGVVTEISWGNPHVTSLSRSRAPMASRVRSRSKPARRRIS